jgi:hypothetical protein
MKPVFSKPVFVLPFTCVALLAGCSVQSGRDDLNRRQDAIGPIVKCDQLDSSSCGANSACELTRAVCPGCEANGTCANTTCLSCRTRGSQNSPCEGRGETQCNADPLCHANYTQYECAMVMPLDGGPFGGCPRLFTSCSMNLPPQDPCAGLPPSMCTAPFCRQILAQALPASCDANGNCQVDTSDQYLGCEVNITSCETNCDCAVNEYCRVTVTHLDPVRPPPLDDGGYAQPPIPPSDVRSGICERVPGIAPVPVTPTDPDVMDAGSASTGP